MEETNRGRMFGTAGARVRLGIERLFVNYLGRLHRDRSEELRKALESDGGWPMHVDATGEHGRGTLFVVMAGWRQWVLGAWKPSTEKAELLLPCLRETVRLFGAPCAAMRDMGRAVTPALEDLPAEAALVNNLKREDYVRIICGSLDNLPEAFAQLDRKEKEQRLRGDPAPNEDGVGTVLQLATASLSTPDRRLITREAMDRRMKAAAGSRAPRYQI